MDINDNTQMLTICVSEASSCREIVPIMPRPNAIIKCKHKLSWKLILVIGTMTVKTKVYAVEDFQNCSS